MKHFPLLMIIKMVVLTMLLVVPGQALLAKTTPSKNRGGRQAG